MKNYRFVLFFSVSFILIQNLIRFYFCLEMFPNVVDFLQVFLIGFFWDTSLLLPILCLLFPFYFILDRFKFKQHYASMVIGFLSILILVFIGFCEIIFWQEFHSRFNFIAVDYLIYTNEVLANIKESYPIEKIAIALIALSLFLSFVVRKISSSLAFSVNLKKWWLGCALISLAQWFMIQPWIQMRTPDFRIDQLSRNGMIEFLRAFRSNEIDYKTFYKTLPDEKLTAKWSEITSSPSTSIPLFSTKPNVVVIVVESLGAKFIKSLGGQEQTTPYLNKLSEESLFFEQLYSTGTRTVRGLEAINLSVPPTPGYAVVKRPRHKNLYSMGNTFKQNGYSPIFLYGGNGFFDNMNSFFSGNQFQTIDLQDFSQDEITFKNAWGVCDEDMFNKAEKILSERKEKNPFLLFMLTTSNHRPFTYPNNKIDIPSGESRMGAVKYTDYAIGQFLEKAKKTSWFSQTLFVIIADHSTEGRGRFDLEVSDFHIPLWIYAPGIIQPQKVSKLASQIDLLPTMISLLGLKDNSPFFGKNILDPANLDERALIGNYQFVGHFKNKTLTTLGPNQVVRSFTYDPQTRIQAPTDKTDFLEETITYYQYASQLLKDGWYELKEAHYSN